MTTANYCNHWNRLHKKRRKRQKEKGLSRGKKDNYAGFAAKILSELLILAGKVIVIKDVVPAHYDDYGILTVSIYDFLLGEVLIN